MRGRLLILLENKMIVLLSLPVKSSSPECGQGLTADVHSTKTLGAILLPHILLVRPALCPEGPHTLLGRYTHDPSS